MITESRHEIKKSETKCLRGFPGLMEGLFSGYGSEMAVSNPADVNEMQRANTGKVSWYRPTFSSPNVWLKKIR